MDSEHEAALSTLLQQIPIRKEKREWYTWEILYIRSSDPLQLFVKTPKH
jgi:hypothetical protein